MARAYLAGTAAVASRMVADNNYALLKTSQDKLSGLRREHAQVPHVEEALKAMCIQLRTMAMEQAAYR